MSAGDGQARRLANLERGKATRFQPGKSGNPSGQLTPEKRTFREIMDELGALPAGPNRASRRDEAARAFFDAVRDGQAWAVREYLAREWPATLHLSGSLGVEVSTDDALEQLEGALSRREARVAHVNGASGALPNGHAHDESGS